MENEMIATVAEHGVKIISLEKRVKELEAVNKQIQELTISVHDLANSVSDMVNIQKKHGEEIEKMKEEPAQNWKNLKSTIITCIITALVSGAIGSLITFITTH